MEDIGYVKHCTENILNTYWLLRSEIYALEWVKPILKLYKDAVEKLEFGCKITISHAIKELTNLRLELTDNQSKLSEILLNDFKNRFVLLFNT